MMQTAKKFVIPALTAVLTLGVASVPATARDNGAPATANQKTEKPKRKGSSCAYRRTINGFSVVDDEHFVLRSGVRHYLVTLSSGCHHLDFEMKIAIKSMPAAGMCVERGDRVILNRHWSCLIRDIEPVENKEEAKKLVEERAKAKEKEGGSD